MPDTEATLDEQLAAARKREERKKETYQEKVIRLRREAHEREAGRQAARTEADAQRARVKEGKQYTKELKEKFDFTKSIAKAAPKMATSLEDMLSAGIGKPPPHWEQTEYDNSYQGIFETYEPLKPKKLDYQQLEYEEYVHEPYEINPSTYKPFEYIPLDYQSPIKDPEHYKPYEHLPAEYQGGAFDTVREEVEEAVSPPEPDDWTQSPLFKPTGIGENLMGKPSEPGFVMLSDIDSTSPLKKTGVGDTLMGEAGAKSPLEETGMGEVLIGKGIESSPLEATGMGSRMFGDGGEQRKPWEDLPVYSQNIERVSIGKTYEPEPTTEPEPVVETVETEADKFEAKLTGTKPEPVPLVSLGQQRLRPIPLNNQRQQTVVNKPRKVIPVNEPIGRFTSIPE